MSDGPFSSLQVSASALGAERLRMNVIASNLANANVLGTPEGGPYRRRVVVFEPVLQGIASSMRPEASQGVKARVELDRNTPHETRHDPTNAFADAAGDVRLPNVNPMFEMVDLMTAARAYESNLSALKIQREMLQKTIQLGK